MGLLDMDFQTFFFYGKNHLHFTYPFYKSKEMFCFKKWTFDFYTATHGELELWVSIEKAQS